MSFNHLIESLEDETLLMLIQDKAPLLDELKALEQTLEIRRSNVLYQFEFENAEALKRLEVLREEMKQLESDLDAITKMSVEHTRRKKYLGGMITASVRRRVSEYQRDEAVQAWAERTFPQAKTLPKDTSKIIEYLLDHFPGLLEVDWKAVEKYALSVHPYESPSGELFDRSRLVYEDSPIPVEFYISPAFNFEKLVREVSDIQQFTGSNE